MTEIERPASGQAPEDRSEEAIRALLASAGTRAHLPEAEIAAVTAAARDEWRRRYVRRWTPGRRFALVAAAAAAMATGAALLLTRNDAPAPDPPVAVVERLSGSATVEGDGGAPPRGLAVGGSLLTGSTVVTKEGGQLSIRMASGASVRLDASTRARLESLALVDLVSGAVYVDTGSGRGAEVSVRTSLGLFEAVGTRYEVRAPEGGEGARLRVREGTVALRRAEGPVLARAGQTLTVLSDGTVQPGTTSVAGSDWEWTVRAAPVPPIEGRTAREILDWLCRETGWRIRVEDAETARVRATTRLHGSASHLTPFEVPSVVLASCGLSHRLEGDALVVGPARRPQ